MMIQHAFFDLDNTLWDFKKNSKVALQHLSSQYGMEEKYGIDFSTFYEVYSKINQGYWDLFRDGKITKQELLTNRFKEAFHKLGIPNETISEGFRTHYLDMLPKGGVLKEGAEDLLESLARQNIKIHLITNGFDKVSKEKVKYSGLYKWTSTLLTSDAAGVTKPDPAIFQMALDQAHAKLENSIMIGDDWEADIIGAVDFGFPIVFYFSQEARELPDNVVQIKELPELQQCLQGDVRQILK